jgi:hypothetical protein
MELTKEYFDEQLKNLASKEDLIELRHDVTSLHSEMSGVRADVREIKETVARIDKRDLEDSNAFAKDIIQLQKDVKELNLKHAS